MTKTNAKLRWGVVGLGGVVTQRFAPALVRSGRSTLVACASRDEVKRREFAAKFGARSAYATFDALLADADVDAVYIATPNSLHYTQAAAALNAGKHVLCEKPLTQTVAEGEALLATARGSGRLLKVAFQFRFEEAFLRVREHLRAGRLGELRTLTFTGVSPANAPGEWRRQPAEGGILADLGVHLLDLAQWLTGEAFADISALAHPADMTSAPVRTITLLGTLGVACQAVVRVGRETPFGRQSLTIEGTLGTAHVDGWRGAPEVVLELADGSGRTADRFAPAPLFEREIAAFEDEVGGTTTALATAEDGAAIVRLVAAAGESVRTGRRVSLG